jgi:hypothetical protein
MVWHRVTHAPWGYSIGYHDEAFIELTTGLRVVKKHYQKGRFLFYSFVRKKIANRLRKR